MGCRDKGAPAVRVARMRRLLAGLDAQAGRVLGLTSGHAESRIDDDLFAFALLPFREQLVDAVLGIFHACEGCFVILDGGVQQHRRQTHVHTLRQRNG